MQVLGTTYDGKFTIDVWTSESGFLVDTTPELKAEVEKVLKLWKESKDLKGYCPFEREKKIYEYKTPGYGVSTVTEHYGVTYVRLYKIVNVKKLWTSEKGYISKPTPEIEAEVEKISKLLEEFEPKTSYLSNKISKYNTPGYGAIVDINKEHKEVICLYKILD